MTDDAKVDGRYTADQVRERHKRLRAERGYGFEAFDWLAERDPAFEGVRLDCIDVTYTRKDSTIPVKYRELIAASVLAFRGYPSVRVHLERALRNGATVDEVVHALEMASIPGGQATLHFGLEHLLSLRSSAPELFDDGSPAEAGRGARG